MTNSFSFQKYAREAILASSLKAPLIGLLFLSACSQQQPSSLNPIMGEQLSSQAQEQVKKSDKVALLLPLSGQHQGLGQSMQKAAEMSLFDHGGDKLNVAMYDTQSSDSGAMQAAQKAVQEGAGLIVGPIFSSHVQAVSQVARRSGINVVSFSNNKNIASGGVFALGFSPEEQVRQIMSYAVSHGKQSFGVLVPRNAYGTLVEQEIQQLRKQYHFDVEFIPYDIGSQNLGHDLNPLKTLKIDALFIPEGGRSLSRLISAILYQEISLNGIQLMGTGQWDEGKITENHTLMGAWISAPDPQGRLSFDGKFQQAYGETPDRLATLAYDVISMLAVLRRHHGERSFGVAALTQSRGFDGVDGLFRLKQVGTTDRRLSILKVTPQGLQPLQMAESTF